MITSRPNTPSFDDWKRDLMKAGIDQRHAMWRLGDLLLEGLEKFNDGDVMTAAEALGHEYQTLMNYKSVAKAFPNDPNRKDRRRLNLPFSFHQDLVKLDEATRCAFLEGCEQHGWKRPELRERVKAWKGGDLAACNKGWKPEPKQIDVPDVTAGGKDGDEDKPVFDASDAGEAVAAEKREAFAEQDLSDANQVLLDALSAVERATAYKNMVHVNRDRVNMKRVLSSIVALEQLLPSAQRYHSAGSTLAPSQHPAGPRERATSSRPAPAPQSEPAPAGSRSADGETDTQREPPSVSPSSSDEPELPDYLRRAKA